MSSQRLRTQIFPQERSRWLALVLVAACYGSPVEDGAHSVRNGSSKKIRVHKARDVGSPTWHWAEKINLSTGSEQEDVYLERPGLKESYVQFEDGVERKDQFVVHSGELAVLVYQGDNAPLVIATQPYVPSDDDPGYGDDPGSGGGGSCPCTAVNTCRGDIPEIRCTYCDAVTLLQCAARNLETCCKEGASRSACKRQLDDSIATNNNNARALGKACF